MAKGDAVGAVVQVAANTYLTIQPAADVEWLITTIATRGDGVNSGNASLYDGTNRSDTLLSPDITIGEGNKDYQAIRDGKIFLSNSLYMQIRNEADAQQFLSYCGVQWK